MFYSLDNLVVRIHIDSGMLRVTADVKMALPHFSWRAAEVARIVLAVS